MLFWSDHRCNFAQNEDIVEWARGWMADGVVRTLPFSPSRTHPRTLSLTRSLTLSPSLSHTHTLSLSHSHSHSHSHTLSHSHSYTLSRRFRLSLFGAHQSGPGLISGRKLTGVYRGPSVLTRKLATCVKQRWAFASGSGHSSPVSIGWTVCFLAGYPERDSTFLSPASLWL